MTLPSSGPLSFSQIAGELGDSASGFSMTRPDARALAGVAGGPIAVSNFYGKSAYTPMSPNIGGDQADTFMASSYDFSLTCTPGGGRAPYGYAWAIFNVGGAGSAAFASSSDQQTAVVQINISGGLGSECACQAQCTVTDATSAVVASNIVTLSFTAA
jgi:hypothetical protein